MSRKKIAFLLNPKSGGGHAERLQHQIPQQLHDLGMSPDQYLIHINQSQDIASQATSLTQAAERLIAVGGDGTAVAAIAGVHASGEDVPIGIIPTGTGNDLARMMNMNLPCTIADLKKCLNGFLHADTVPLDIWRVNGQFMVNYLGIGFDAAVIRSFHHYRHCGKLPFISGFANKCIYALFGLAHAFTGIKGTPVLRVHCNKESHTRSLRRHRQLILSNLPFYAGGTMVAPAADYQDQRLDITLIPTMAHFLGLFAAQLIPRLQKWYGSKLFHYQAERIEIDVPSGNFLQIDGEDKTELLKTGKVTVEYSGRVSLLRASGKRSISEA